MKLIKDIRLYADHDSTRERSGTNYQYDFKLCLKVIQRLLFLLRHRGFGFGEFDHLYVNFTPCLPHGEVQDVNRHTIEKFAWMHYVDVGCNLDLFNSWELEKKTAFVLESVRKAALLKAPEEQCELFADTFAEVMEQGEKLLLPYKVKENENYRVEILLRITDELDFLPMIRVTDREGAPVTEVSLRAYGRNDFITQISTISIGKRSVRINPRKNWDTDYYGLKPIKIEW